MPLRFSHLIGVLLGRGLYRFSNDLRRISSINIRLCFPDWSEEQRQALIRESLEESGKTAFELGALWFWSPRRVLSLVREISGGELLEQAMAKGKGVILVSPHLGAWEVIGLYCAMRWPMINLYRPPRLEGLGTMIRQARERAGATLAPTDSSGVRALYKALGRGELLGILPDQDPGREAGVFAPFFGVPANTMTLLPRLVRKSGAAVLFTYAERLPRGRGYHLHFILASEELAAVDIEQAATSLNAGVEACVRQLPAQYQWGYKRFKTQPESDKEPY